jgi:chitodextrinase
MKYQVLSDLMSSTLLIGTLFFALIILSLGAAYELQAAVGLVAAYSFNEGSGTTVTDASGNGNTGTIQGATWTSAGKFGNALTFNGTSNWVTVNDAASLHATNALTLETWVYPTANQSGWRTIIQKQIDTYFLHWSNSSGARKPAGGGTFNGAVSYITAPNTIPINSWSYLTLTYDGAMLRLYVNGVQVSSIAKTGTIETNSNPLRIGGNSTYGEYFKGRIDEIRIYNRALSQLEIQSDMNTSIGEAPSDTVAPTVSMTTPLNGTTVSGNAVAVSATASDNVGVIGVQFKLDGTNLGAEAITTPYAISWNTTTVANGSHTLTAVARDAAGNASTSAAAVVTVSNTDTTPPSTPVGISATTVSFAQINLVWTASTDNIGVTGYQVFRCQGAGCTPTVLIATSTATTYIDAGLSPSTTYVYTVAALDAAGNTSGPSGVVSATTIAQDTTPPSPPANLTATAISPAQINLSWTASTDNVGVTGYAVFRNSTQVGTSLATSYADTGLVAGATYTYTVAALDAAGNVSTQSAAASATTQTRDTTPPTVSVTSPAAGQTIAGTITVSAVASDNVGVVGVQFQRNGANLGVEVVTAPYILYWDTTTVANASHTLTAVARDAVGNTSTSTPVTVTVANASATDPSVIGQWTGPFPWPIVAVHMSLLSTGKVLAWDDHTDTSGSDTPAGGTTVWDPTANTFTPVPTTSDHNLFCSGHTELADGRVMVVGGHTDFDVGQADINIFDPTTQTWSLAAPMSIGRWYPTGTTLGDGRVLATLGTVTCNTCIAGTPEVYNLATNSWTSLTGANNPFTPYYPHMLVLPNGKVFAAAASEYSIISRVLDVQAQTWSNVGSTAIDGTASVMYQPGKIMKSGGAWDDGLGTPSPATYVIDMNQPSPSWRQVGSMAFARVTHNQTFLPDGTVLVTGGSRSANVAQGSASVYDAELWSPTTETWKTMAKMQVQRVYHSTALLLPDGRVLVGGSGRFSGGANQLSVEIYSPPYLFKGPRPAIASAPGTIQYASSFFVGTPDVSRVTSVSLIRLGSVTHHFNQNQRFMSLTFTPISGGLTIQGPQNGNYAPPGYYMLFLLDSNGVPSIASFVRLPAPYEDTQSPTAPTNLTATGLVGSATLSWTAATDNVGVTGYNIYRSTTSGFTPSVGNKVGETTATTFTNTGLVGGTYYYVVVAHDVAVNTSLPSNEASVIVTPDTSSPSTPTGLTATAVSSSQINLSWTTSTDNVGVEGYQVFRNGSQVATTTVSTYSDIGLTASTTYTYTVTAFDASANISPSSQTVSATAFPGSSLPPGLVAAYSFSEGTGITTTDNSGSGNTGTLTNGPTWTSGKYGNALSYNGINNYVAVRNTFDIAALPFTIAVWVNPTNYDDYRKVFSKRTSWAANNMRVDLTLYSSSGHVVLEQPNQILEFSYAPPLNTWTHLAVVARTTGTELYVNGNLTQTLGAFTLGGNAAAPVRLGCAGDGQDPFLGRIDNLRIYNRALTQSEIQSDLVSIQ